MLLSPPLLLPSSPPFLLSPFYSLLFYPGGPGSDPLATESRRCKLQIAPSHHWTPLSLLPFLFAPAAPTAGHSARADSSCATAARAGSWPSAHLTSSQSMQQIWTMLQHDGPNHLGLMPPPPVPGRGPRRLELYLLLRQLRDQAGHPVAGRSRPLSPPAVNS